MPEPIYTMVFYILVIKCIQRYIMSDLYRYMQCVVQKRPASAKHVFCISKWVHLFRNMFQFSCLLLEIESRKCCVWFFKSMKPYLFTSNNEKCLKMQIKRRKVLHLVRVYEYVWVLINHHNNYFHCKSKTTKQSL